MVVRYKILLLILFVLNNTSVIHAQLTSNWILDFEFGIEQHDKRLFDYSEKETLLAEQPEKWGTYHLNVSIQRRMWVKHQFSSYFGMGIGYEKATFLRPFNQLYFKDLTEILLVTNKYEKIKMPLFFSVIYQPVNQWFISGKLISTILLYRSIDNTKYDSSVFPYTKSCFELDDVNFSIGINYLMDKIYLGISTRVINFQKIDKIIFNHLIKDPRVDQKWEWYNPLRFDFTIGYMW